MIHTDQLQRELHVQSTPKRIVCLVPSLTELLVDLGLEKTIVGVTKFCVHPKHLRTQKTVVGGTKHVHFSKIKALNPDIIICNKEENTLDIVKGCEAIANVHVSDLYTIDDVITLIAMYGELFNCRAQAQSISNQIKVSLDDFVNYCQDVKPLNVVYCIWKKPWMVAANKTFIHYMLRLNKFNNVYSNLERYPEINISDLKILDVDVVLLSSEPYPFKQKEIDEIENDLKIKATLVDGEYFSWYGSRLLNAFAYFKQLRHKLF